MFYESVFFFLMIRRPPSSTRTATLFPYTTLCRSVVNMMAVGSSQQVLLEVRFSEMLRSAAKQIGVSSAFSSDSGKFLGSTGSSVSLLADESGNPVIALGDRKSTRLNSSH